MLRRLVPHPLAGGHGPGAEGFDNALVPPGDAQVDQADGVAPVVGIGAGHAGGREGDVTAQGLPGPAGHGLRHLGGDGPVGIQQILRHAQDMVLDCVGVAHDAPPEDRRGTGAVRDELGDEAAGAGLGRAQRQTLRL